MKALSQLLERVPEIKRTSSYAILKPIVEGTVAENLKTVQMAAILHHIQLFMRSGHEVMPDNISAFAERFEMALTDWQTAAKIYERLGELRKVAPDLIAEDLELRLVRGGTLDEKFVGDINVIATTDSSIELRIDLSDQMQIHKDRQFLFAKTTDGVRDFVIRAEYGQGEQLNGFRIQNVIDGATEMALSLDDQTNSYIFRNRISSNLQDENLGPGKLTLVNNRYFQFEPESGGVVRIFGLDASRETFTVKRDGVRQVRVERLAHTLEQERLEQVLKQLWSTDEVVDTYATVRQNLLKVQFRAL